MLLVCSTLPGHCRSLSSGGLLAARSTQSQNDPMQGLLLESSGVRGTDPKLTLTWAQGEHVFTPLSLYNCILIIKLTLFYCVH